MSRSLRPLALIFALLPASARAQTLLASHFATEVERLGASIADAGDFDGDGVRDRIVGAPLGGRARVYSGASGAMLKSWSHGASFGHAVLGVGDVNGDGIDDVAVTLPLEAPGGAVYLYAGGSGVQLRKIESAVAGEKFGFALATAGDLTGDGLPEVAIGAPAKGPTGASQGLVYVYSFALDSFVRIHAPPSQAGTDFGTAIADAGDVDGDGAHDLLIGAPTANGAGSARLYSGRSGVVLHSFEGPASSYSFGASVAALGPVEPGGHPCVAIGAPNLIAVGGTKGYVAVYDAVTGTLRYSVAGPLGSAFGAALAGVGNAGGASGGDLLVGAPPEDILLTGKPGAAYLLRGSDGALLHAFTGPGPGSAYGFAVAGLRSIDGDPYADVAIGAPLLGGNKGAVYVHGGLAPCGTVATVGSGCPGTFGITPTLSLSGCAKTYQASPLTLSIGSGPHFETTALLFIGFGSGSIWQNPWCALQLDHLIGPPFALQLKPASGPIGPLFGSGQFTATASLPAGGAALELRLQALVLDPGSPFGISATNAVELSLAP